MRRVHDLNGLAHDELDLRVRWRDRVSSGPLVAGYLVSSSSIPPIHD